MLRHLPYIRSSGGRSLSTERRDNDDGVRGHGCHLAYLCIYSSANGHPLTLMVVSGTGRQGQGGESECRDNATRQNVRRYRRVNGIDANRLLPENAALVREQVLGDIAPIGELEVANNPLRILVPEPTSCIETSGLESRVLSFQRMMSVAVWKAADGVALFA